MPEGSLILQVFAYIPDGERSLVFDHADLPEPGTQVPARPLGDGEDSIGGAVRKAVEETRLAGLIVAGTLGETVVDVRPWGEDEEHHWTFVHLRCAGQPPESWEHWEENPHGVPGFACLSQSPRSVRGSV